MIIRRCNFLIELILVSRELIFRFISIDLCFHNHHPCLNLAGRKSTSPTHKDIEPIPALAASQFTVNLHIGELPFIIPTEYLFQKSTKEDIAETVVFITIHQIR